MHTVTDRFQMQLLLTCSRACNYVLSCAESWAGIIHVNSHSAEGTVYLGTAHCHVTIPSINAFEYCTCCHRPSRLNQDIETNTTAFHLSNVLTISNHFYSVTLPTITDYSWSFLPATEYDPTHELTDHTELNPGPCQTVSQCTSQPIISITKPLGHWTRLIACSHQFDEKNVLICRQASANLR